MQGLLAAEISNPSAGDKVRETLRTFRYMNLVDSETNQLWEPSRVLDRLTEVLAMAKRLQTALPDWTEPTKLSVLWASYPEPMKTYFQFEQNAGVCPTTDGTTCAQLTNTLTGYYMQYLNFNGARPETNDGNGRGNKRQRNGRNGGWTPRGNDRDRDGGNGQGGGNRSDNYRGGNNI